MEITNHELHIIITRMEGKVDSLLEKQKEHETWQEQHDKKDDERFKDLNRYGSSIAMISSIISGGVMYAWNYLTKKV